MMLLLSNVSSYLFRYNVELIVSEEEEEYNTLESRIDLSHMDCWNDGRSYFGYYGWLFQSIC